MSRPSTASPTISARASTGCYDVAKEMDAEDGVIWVYGLGDDGVMAFTDFGIETLIELIKIHREPPSTHS